MGDGALGPGPEVGSHLEDTESLTEQLEGMDPLDEERVEALLLRPDFGQMVASAIWQTDHPTARSESRKRHQEFGFAGVRLVGHKDQSFQLSPLFEGDERSISLSTQSADWITDIDAPPTVSFNMHTHPTNLRETELFTSMLGRELGSKVATQQVVVDYFSPRDLENHLVVAQREDLSLISGLGVINTDQKSGTLILISLNTADSLSGLDTKRVFDQAARYKQTKDKDYLDAYREAGFNAVALRVDLKGPQYFDQQAVTMASMQLTQRS